jgi:hypothetical protein
MAAQRKTLSPALALAPLEQQHFDWEPVRADIAGRAPDFANCSGGVAVHFLIVTPGLTRGPAFVLSEAINRCQFLETSFQRTWQRYR